ncbi:phosducin [Drepanopeziza brunnea f. sp. 'multigermtubi' MB_m1]|uniref:Phosducin n=1 Tax=Marssonina brunnea f. sp. multigermtubi (strain MB_m1) TaxID=1072389 RepID=K1Y5G8_MARBU|nr:phosducin [Drepanopeziza brunnea f. sp. 'multigermtubi' MB_m1]EKD20434.1 phosducin [Drepanopeziza brunnea f. sp. 'multigermtubi' MB_m1]
MAARTAAEEEFDSILQKASAHAKLPYHASDVHDYAHDAEHSEDEADEEAAFLQKQVAENMRMMPSLDPRGGPMYLPHRDFDSGRTTGVKGVIADARSFEEARKQQSGGASWKSRARSGSRRGARTNEESAGGNKRASTFKDEGEGSDDEDEEEFVQRWRMQRREELRREGSDIRNRRTSPSMRRFGRFDEVDALGYLDAIEKVTRDTVVCVFVYDPECAVSQVISDALTPLVSKNPGIHFVRIHYEAIEFDNAGVPAILAYKNQGDLFANLTYIIDQIPEDTLFDTQALETILRNNKVL